MLYRRVMTRAITWRLLRLAVAMTALVGGACALSLACGSGADATGGGFGTGGIIAADADLSGTLDCTTGKFTGQLINGVYGLSFNVNTPPLPDPNNKFQGPLVSDYNGAMSSFVNGQWSMAIGNPTQGACIG